MSVDPGERKLIVVNVSHKVMERVQSVINRDKLAAHVYVMFEVSTGPHEYVRFFLGMRDKQRGNPDAKASYMFDIQLLLDLNADWGMIVEDKTLAMLREVVKQAGYA